MATYNGEPYIQTQLESFLGQTILPDEVVICDDGSIDSTMEILDEFVASAPFNVRVFQNKTNLGYSRNFERAIGLCKGDLIFMSDQDDVWFPEKLEVVLNRFNSADRPFVVINNAEITNSSLYPTGLTNFDQHRSAGFADDFLVYGCSTAFRAEFLPVILPVPHEYFVHDVWINRIGVYLRCRAVVEQTLQYYRRHDKNTSLWFPNKTRRITIFDRIRHYAPGDTRAACRRRLDALDIICSRLTNKRNAIDILLKENLDVDKVLADICLEQDVVSRRLNLLEKSRIIRIIPALDMLLAGDYRYFSGLMSFVKDLIQ
jgi:glycosyltransferase involved in cell wall biosynthesis